jgi:hypothetical protein
MPSQFAIHGDRSPLVDSHKLNDHLGEGQRSRVKAKCRWTGILVLGGSLYSAAAAAIDVKVSSSDDREDVCGFEKICSEQGCPGE